MDEETNNVWAKADLAAPPTPGYWSRGVWMKDSQGNLIFYWHYGDTNSVYGWEIDHIIPLSKGGSDALYNKQPLQWRANREKHNKLRQEDILRKMWGG